MNNNYSNQNNQDYNNPNYNNQNYDPMTGQPIQNNYQQPYNQQNYNPQYNQQMPMNNANTDKSDNTKLIIAIILLIVGWFFAGIFCGAGAIILSTQIKKKSAGKIVILVLGIIEVVLTVIGIFANVILTVLS